MSNWDWAQITNDGWDSFKSKVLAGIESDPLIEAGIRSVNKVVTMKAQVATEAPSTSLLGKGDLLSQVQSIIVDGMGTFEVIVRRRGPLLLVLLM